MNRTRKGTRVEQHTTGQMCTLRASHTPAHARPLMRAKIRAREVSHNAFFFLHKKTLSKYCDIEGGGYNTNIKQQQVLKSDKRTTDKKPSLDVNAKIIRIYELGNENTG